MDCFRRIRDILDNLDRDQPSVQSLLKLEAESVNALAELPEECSSALVKEAREYLIVDPARKDAEFNFQVLLQAIADRDEPEAVSITLDALFSSTAVDKESYVSMFLSIDPPDAEASLAAHLESLHIDSETEVANLQQALIALRSASGQRFASVVRKQVDHPSPAVRAAVEDFLYGSTE